MKLSRIFLICQVVILSGTINFNDKTTNEFSPLKPVLNN
ncbi:MAG: hypothetical protein ACI9L6_001635 [Flavobacterium sp.]|jgi:hypothetical protein